MDFLIAVLVLFGSLLFAIVGNMISNELYNCVPSCTRWLIERAVARAPDKFRDRYREQWLADNKDWQGGKLAKLCHAFGCCLAVYLIAQNYRTENTFKTIEISGKNWELAIVIRARGIHAWTSFPYSLLFKNVWRILIESRFTGIRIHFRKFDVGRSTSDQTF